MNTDFTQRFCLLGTVNLTKNMNNGVGFNLRSQFSWADVKYDLVFDIDMSSSRHVDNRKKYILVLCEGLTRGLDDTTMTEEAKYPINFTEFGKDLY